MIFLSVHDGHNASAALLIDGKIVGAVQEERFTRIKNDFTFPIRSIKWLLNSNHLYANDISKVILYKLLKQKILIQMQFYSLSRVFFSKN